MSFFHRHVCRAGFLLVALLVTLGRGSEAVAAMRFCNTTEYPIEAAVAYRGQTQDEQDAWVSEGWWQIQPGQCARVYDKPLDQRFYFYYATSLMAVGPDKKPYLWSGEKYKFCTNTIAFRIEGDNNCEDRGYQAKGFLQVDVGQNTRDYTLDFKDGG